MRKVEWLSEPEAAKMVGLAPRTLRRYAKARTVPINYTSPRGRHYLYVKADIDKYLLEFSTLTA